MRAMDARGFGLTEFLVVMVIVALAVCALLTCFRGGALGASADETASVGSPTASPVAAATTPASCGAPAVSAATAGGAGGRVLG